MIEKHSTSLSVFAIRLNTISWGSILLILIFYYFFCQPSVVYNALFNFYLCNLIQRMTEGYENSLIVLENTEDCNKSYILYNPNICIIIHNA